jgi:hypothetical protein
VEKRPAPDMTAHLPYLHAVADSLKAVGLNAGRVEDTSDEWRSGFISIAASPDDDPDDDSEDRFVLCWDWRHGWLSAWESQESIRLIRYYPGPVTVGPAEIASAAGARLAGNSEGWSTAQPGWHHDPDDGGYEEGFAADLERDLAEFVGRQPGGEGRTA